jgi:hypothetical protein
MTPPTGTRADAWLAGALWLVAGAGFGFVISVVGLATVPVALVVAALLPTVGPRWALAGLVTVAAAVMALAGFVGSSSTEDCSGSSTGDTVCRTVTSRPDALAWYVPAGMLAVLAVVLVVVAARSGLRHPPAHLAFLALSGAGVLPLVVAWLNRDGPGDVCTAWSGGQCVAGTEEWSPWPWLAAGVVLVVAGVVLTAVVGRRR